MGDDEALEQFCTAEHPRLVGALTLYTGDRELAVDLAQEALVKVCQHWPRVRTMEAPGAWAHATALNLARSTFRRRRAERRALAREDAPQTASPHEARAAVLDVRRAVAALPPRQRTAVVLRYFLDHDVEQTAAIMRCRAGTVRALTSQALANLRASGLAVATEVAS